VSSDLHRSIFMTFLRRPVCGRKYTSILPIPRLLSDMAMPAGYAATQSGDLVDQLRIMIDAIGADGGLRTTPAAMVRLRSTGQAILDDIASCRLSPIV
jgi:hypothetical protein